MVRYIFSFLFFLLCSTCETQAASNQETGTLVVSFQTGTKGERLSRVRFLLINESLQEQMYPKGNSFIEDEDKLKRLVAIEDLPAGNYRIKFLIPNTDGLFEEVPDRFITIEPKESLKIDQTIKPRYVSLKAISTVFPEDKKPNAPLTLTLRDKLGNISHQSNTGKMISHHLHPGSYTLIFEPIPGYLTPAPISFNALPGRTVGVLTGTYRWLGEPLPSASKEVAETIIVPPSRPGGTTFINQINAQLSVTVNIPQAHWTLLKNNQSIYVGLGSAVNLQFPEGENFRITAEEIEGYNAYINPPFPFSLYAGQTIRAEIIYERTFGSLTVESNFPDSDSVVITTTNLKNKKSRSFTMKAKNGKIFWVSPQIPTGDYEISYQLPKGYEPIPPERVYIHTGERRRLTPKLFINGVLTIQANVPEAIFTVKSVSDGSIWQGDGREYTFRGLPGGVYQLMFSSNNPDFFIPPPDMKVALSGKENKVIQAPYQAGGKVIVRSNMDRNTVIIEGLSNRKINIKELIYEQKRAFTLPEGKYKITIEPMQNAHLSALKLLTPEPVEVTVRALATQTVDLPYSVVQQEVRNPLSMLAISTNISSANFTVTRVNGNSNEVVGTYTGKETQISLSPGNYLINFSEVPNYKIPKPLNVTVVKDKNQTVIGEYQSFQDLVKIPTGKSILGNVATEADIQQNNAVVVNIKEFSLGTYEVTNAQYAAWLNDALKKNTISYVSEADNQGQVIDLLGRLLFKTFNADPYSQITTQKYQQDTITFTPIPGKDQYPVINVTWYGAIAYCEDNNVRLPTEAEWEKAGGMAQNNEGMLNKFRYGFGRNDIDPSWANYKINDRPIQYFQVLTTPVGFYNGINPMPLMPSEHRQMKTQLAKSPYGAFDMSGNVWEWVSDWYSDDYIKNASMNDPKGPLTGTKKVVKGGCYDSLADGVTVAERMGLDPQHADAYTGFRVAK